MFVSMRSGSLHKRCGCWPLVLGLLVMIMPALTWAEKADSGVTSSLTDRTQVHGFLTQGFVYTSDNKFFGDSDEGSFDLTEIGVNASMQLHPMWLVSGQLLYRNAGEMYQDDVTVDYALVDFVPISDENRTLGVILGRFKNPLGLYNDTRDVAFTRPGIYVPQTVYFDKVRNMILSNDGVQFHGDFNFSLNHRLSLQLGGGRSPIDENVRATYLGPGLEGDLEYGDPTYVGRALYDWNEGELRLALSGA